MVSETKVLLEGLWFPEAPRWRNGRLWFSDIYDEKVMTTDLQGCAEVVIQVPGRPSGLGWLPDGHILIVSMRNRRLLRLDPLGLTEVADLSELISPFCNDMVVDSMGRAYIGSIGFNPQSPPKAPRLAEIVLVMPDGKAQVVADELAFPNGSIITPDGLTFIVAETLAARLTAFAIEPDGSLRGRRTWAQFDDLGPQLPGPGRITPDGICLDDEGAIWVASFGTAEVIRVHEGGKVTQRVKVATAPYACMLGGPDRRTLFVLTAERVPFGQSRTKGQGRIETIEVDVPGVGLP